MTTTQVQRRRGTQAENDAFTGASGELTYTTDTERIAMHNGTGAGGMLFPNYQDIQEGAFDYAADGGTANVITASTVTAPITLIAGLSIRVKILASNTAAATLQWDTLTAKSIKKFIGGTKVDLESSDLRAGNIYRFDYDGSDWIAAIPSATGGRLLAINAFASSGTWTKPLGTAAVEVLVTGGGGGGGRYTGAKDGGASSFGTHVSGLGGIAGGGTETGGGGSGNLFAVYVGGNWSYDGNGSTIYGAGQAYGAGGKGFYTGGASYSGSGGGTAHSYITTAIGATETITIGGGGAAGEDGLVGRAGYCIIKAYS